MPRPKRIIEQPAIEPKPEYKSVRNIVDLLFAYRDKSNGRMAGLIEDCKDDLYRLFLVDWNDKQIDEIPVSPFTNTIYEEWQRRFSREFGEL